MRSIITTLMIKMSKRRKNWRKLLIGLMRSRSVLDQSKIRESVELVGLSHPLVCSLIAFAFILRVKSKQDYHHKKWSIVTLRISVAQADTS